MAIFLETERLVLREFTSDDAADLVALDSDPAVMRYLADEDGQSIESVLENLIPYYRSYYDRGAGFGYWAAIEKATETSLGWFLFRPPRDPQPGDIELGYRLHRVAWGRGFATEGSRALVDKGFRESGVQRVVGFTMAVNGASRRVLEKAGLRYVRTFEDEYSAGIEGAEHGEVEYALTRSEWLAAR